VEPESKRLQILDLLRFCAALGVMVYHLTFVPTFIAGGALFDGLAEITRFGFLGVDLFFMISGFVILWSADNRTALEFAVSRVARLMPSYWVSMTITCIGLSLLAAATYSFRVLAGNTTMAAGLIGIPYIDGVYYTLLIEIKFYVLVFALVLFGQMRRLEYWLLGWLVAMIPAYFFPVPGLRSLTMYPYGPMFVSGGLFFLWWRAGFSWLRLAAIAASCALTCVSMFRIGPEFLNGDHSVGSLSVAASIIVVLYMLFAGVSSGRLRVEHSTLWAKLGAMTYPLYLLHNALGREIARHLEGVAGTIGAVVLSACISLTMAFALANSAERYGCPALKKWFLSLIPNGSARTAAPSRAQLKMLLH